jgi:hypothetical protein
MPARKIASPGNTIALEEIRRIALSLPGVKEGTSYGTKAFRVASQLFIRVHPEGDVLIVRCSQDQRDILVSIDPSIYFFTDHYRNYPWVLVRLNRIHSDALTDLMEQAWRSVTPKKLVNAFDASTPP